MGDQATHIWTQSAYLSVLTHAPSDEVKPLAEAVIPLLGEITVIKNQTGLVMLPYTDTAQGSVFHLGEILVAEAQVRVESGAEGYGMVLGRDLEFAMAVALLDAALAAGVAVTQIHAFLAQQAAAQAEADQDTLRDVQATRVEMETF